MKRSAEDPRKERAKNLMLHGILSNWEKYAQQPWLDELLREEEVERQRRSLERRMKRSRIGRFKSLADFDWSWPHKIEREQIEDLLALEFADEPANVVFVGPNGVGKTTLAQNVAHQAVLRGLTVRMTTASEMLNDLVAQDGSTHLLRRLRRYTSPRLLVIDEVGYLSYDSRHADLLFEVVTRRSQQKPTIVTTNRPFSEWGEVFPNATCVVALVDRLVHKAEIVSIEGESYRLKESQEREAAQSLKRSERRAEKASRGGK